MAYDFTGMGISGEENIIRSDEFNNIVSHQYRDVLDVVKKISNLRKIGVSPRANEEVCGEQIGGGYVYAGKPNPAYVAIETDPEVIRKETEKTVQVCQKYGCPCEFVLKDISTVSHRPENLIVWAKTVSEVLDR